MKKPTAQFLMSFILLGIGSAAFAHPGHDVSGLSAGLMHPFRGFDHLLAMVAVGLWAAQNGGRKIRAVARRFHVDDGSRRKVCANVSVSTTD